MRKRMRKCRMPIKGRKSRRGQRRRTMMETELETVEDEEIALRCRGR